MADSSSTSRKGAEWDVEKVGKSPLTLPLRSRLMSMMIEWRPQRRICTEISVNSTQELLFSDVALRLAGIMLCHAHAREQGT